MAAKSRRAQRDHAPPPLGIEEALRERWPQSQCAERQQEWGQTARVDDGVQVAQAQAQRTMKMPPLTRSVNHRRAQHREERPQTPRTEELPERPQTAHDDELVLFFQAERRNADGQRVCWLEANVGLSCMCTVYTLGAGGGEKLTHRMVRRKEHVAVNPGDTGTM